MAANRNTDTLISGKQMYRLMLAAVICFFSFAAKAEEESKIAIKKPPSSEGSAEVGARVATARDIQAARYAALGLPNVRTNAEAPAAALEDIAQPDAQGLKLLRDAAESMRLSARSYHRVLRVARTLADLDAADKIGRLHLAEALSYRALAEDLRSAA